MKNIVKERIYKYLSRCGEDGDEIISGVIVNGVIVKCGWCKTAIADVCLPHKPNFCPECGCLLDWMPKEKNNLKTCGSCEWLELDMGKCCCHKHKRQIDNYSYPTECPAKFVCDDWEQNEQYGGITE